MGSFYQIEYKVCPKNIRKLGILKLKFRIPLYEKNSRKRKPYISFEFILEETPISPTPK